MQGVYDKNRNRFKTKKAMKEALAAAETVYLEATSVFGNEYGGAVEEAPDGTYTVVGPDPYKARNWYANIKKDGEQVKVS